MKSDRPQIRHDTPQNERTKEHMVGVLFNFCTKLQVVYMLAYATTYIIACVGAATRYSRHWHLPDLAALHSMPLVPSSLCPYVYAFSLSGQRPLLGSETSSCWGTSQNELDALTVIALLL